MAFLLWVLALLPGIGFSALVDKIEVFAFDHFGMYLTALWPSLGASIALAMAAAGILILFPNTWEESVLKTLTKKKR